MARGGVRIGAGRPKGSGRYKEKTKPIRIPESMAQSVSQFIEQGGYQLPVYSSQAITLSESPDYAPETMELNELLVAHAADTFLVRVSGGSMASIGIFDQDILIVNRHIEATNNKIVAAIIDGMLTIKRLNKTRDNRAFLVSENDDFPLLEVSEQNNVHIWGVVTAVIRSLI